jgi:SAM-dependent methyltransferase
MITGGRAKRIFEKYLHKLVENSNTIVDIGTSERFAKELRPYENLFIGKDYKAGGYQPELIYGVYNCDLHTDIESLPFENNSIDAIICLEVLEHVKNPFKAAEEIKRVLKPGGLLLLTTPFLLGYHGKRKKYGDNGTQSHAEYPDFWRFTHEGLEYLFKDFTSVKVEVMNGPVEVGLMVFNLSRFFKFSLIRKLLDMIDKPKISKQTSRHLIFCVK